jgi:hypothetical protein
MTFTMPFEFGDIVLLPFPFTGQSGSKAAVPKLIHNILT